MWPASVSRLTASGWMFSNRRACTRVLPNQRIESQLVATRSQLGRETGGEGTTAGPAPPESHIGGDRRVAAGRGHPRPARIEWSAVSTARPADARAPLADAAAPLADAQASSRRRSALHWTNCSPAIRSPTSSAGGSRPPVTSCIWSAVRSGTRCSGVPSPTWTSLPTRARRRSSRCSTAGRTPSGRPASSSAR